MSDAKGILKLADTKMNLKHMKPWNRKYNHGSRKHLLVLHFLSLPLHFTLDKKNKKTH